MTLAEPVKERNIHAFSRIKLIRKAAMTSKSKRAKQNGCELTGRVASEAPHMVKVVGPLFAAGAFALLALANGVPAAAAQSSTDYFAAHFFDSSSTTANYSVRIHNPVRATNPVCAMVYVFDSTQTLQECCGCPVRSDQMETYSLATDLTANPFSKTPVTVGVIDIVASVINHGSSHAANGGCDPAAALNPAPTLRSWLSNDTQGTSDPFLSAPLDAQEQNRLPALCSSAITIGSPAALCTCGN
jgi:hypothetical protein